MSRTRVALTAAILLGAAAVPQVARAQFAGTGMGSPLGAYGPMQQGMMPAGVGDLAKNHDQEKPDKVLKDVKQGLKDADPNVRVQAIKKLRNLQDPEANKLLIGALSDSDIRVRIKAVDLLGARQANEAVEPLSQLLFLRSTGPLVKLHATAALGRIGDARGALPVMQYLEELRQSGSDERTRGTAVFALGEIGSEKANEILANVAANDKSEVVQRLAQEALEKIDGELPTQHSAQLAQQNRPRVPTDEKLAKLREFDQKLQDMDR